MTHGGLSLVTGATGLLGSHIAEQLRRAGAAVRCLVRPSTLAHRPPEVTLLESWGCELVPGDLADQASVNAAAQGVTTLFHAAAKVGDWGPWKQFVEDTVNGTRRVVEAVKANGVARLLHVSSISVYGYRDGDGQVFDETTSLGYGLHRWSHYSRSKAMADELLLREFAQSQLPVTIVRPSWIYGERDRSTAGRMVTALRTRRARIVGPGDNRLNLCYAGNIAEGAILAAQHPDAVGQAYNLADDGYLTLKEYWAKVAQAAGQPVPTGHVPRLIANVAAFNMEAWGKLLGLRRPPLATRYSVWLMSRRCFFSSEKARQHLGWKTSVGYDEGIQRMVRWWLEHADPERTESRPTVDT